MPCRARARALPLCKWEMGKKNTGVTVRGIRNVLRLYDLSVLDRCSLSADRNDHMSAVKGRCHVVGRT